MQESRSLGREEILAAIAGDVPPVKISPLYRIGLLLVAVAMVLLPLVYVAIIGLVIYGLYLHVSSAGALFEGSGNARGKFAIFVAPLVIGGVLLLFMIKPLFARQPKGPDPQRLAPDEEPTLFAFVERICAAVGAPSPREIHVDCQVNASAGLRRGFLSFFGNDLVLTIGLPLVAGMSLRQLAGVLAHEFGHFAQGGGMRLTYVIRRVNAWFSRVVYERDAWDERLARWSKETDLRLAAVLWVARFFVWLTRKILWALMMAGHAISCFMMRQMEFDADRYEARFSGSDVFESTSLRLKSLGVAHQEAFQLVGQAWQDGRLADDLSRLIEDRVGRIPEETQQKIREHAASEKTGYFDTHPSDRDRIASAQREEAEGVFRLQAPATELFADFDATSRSATEAHYRQLIGDALGQATLVSHESLVAEDEAQRGEREGLERYFGQGFFIHRPLWLPADLEGVGTNPAELASAKESMLRKQSLVGTAFESYREAEERRESANRAGVLLDAGLKINEESFGLPHPTPSGVEAVLDESRATQGRLDDTIDAYLGDARKRMIGALAQLKDERRREAGTLLAALACLQKAGGSAATLRLQFGRLAVLLANLEGREEESKMITSIQIQAKGVAKVLAGFREQLDEPYPFGTGDTPQSIGNRLVGDEIPTPEYAGALYNQAQGALEQYHGTYVRILGRLTSLAGSVEAELGL